MRFASIFCFGMLLVILSTWAGAQSPPYDLLIQGGRVIDPRNSIDGVFDLAIKDGRIARLAPSIAAEEAASLIRAEGLIVTPGLIDLHVHVFHGTDPDSQYSNGPFAVPPDGFTFRSGVTTVVDVGGAGWRDFPQFKRQTIDISQTRVLAFLNIVGSGMKGDPIEQNLGDMDARLTALRIEQFPEFLVGVKVAHYRSRDWDPVDRAVEAGELAGVPVMVDFGHQTPPLSLEELLLDHLRPGDILTHTYAKTHGRDTVVDETGQVEAFARRAQEKGLIFDVGHGAGSFVFEQAVPAIQQNFLPHTISTDLHIRSMNGGMKDLLNVLSKFLNMGMSVPDLIIRTTWNPAQVIHRDDLGQLSEGAVADVALLRVVEGNFGFLDVENKSFTGTRKLECEVTLKDGKVMWDLNALHGTPWDE